MDKPIEKIVKKLTGEPSAREKMSTAFHKFLDEIRDEKGYEGPKGIPGYNPIKGVDYFDGKDGRNPLFVGQTAPVNPQIGDLWYQPD